MLWFKYESAQSINSLCLHWVSDSIEQEVNPSNLETRDFQNLRLRLLGHFLARRRPGLNWHHTSEPRCCLPHTAFSDLITKQNKTKSPPNLLHLTFIGIIFGDLAFIRRTMRYDPPISQVILCYCGTLTRKTVWKLHVNPWSWNGANIDTRLKKNSVFRAGKPENCKWGVSRKRKWKS